MGAKPSSAVQKSAYLEALDDYIDFYEDGTLRKCLMDSNGNRLKDAEGNLKTLRHKFAVYCDDICADADSLDELYERFEALICCCKRAGIGKTFLRFLPADVAVHQELWNHCSPSAWTHEESTSFPQALDQR